MPPFILWFYLVVLAWLAFRRRTLDRKDALYWYVLSLSVTWAAVLIAFLPSQEYASVYGRNVLVLSTTIEIIAGGSGVLVYLCWPTSRTEADRKLAQDDLKVHYQNLIRRMEQWSYLHSEYGDEMICLATKDEKFGPRRSGTPSSLEKDKMHLKEFKKTYDLYLDGKKLSKEHKAKKVETERLLKTSLRKLLEEKGMTIDEAEQFNIVWWLRITIGGEFRSIRMVSIPNDTPPALFGIRDELKQRQDLRKSIYDELVVQSEIRDNERKFLNSLVEEVIAPSKESNYSLPQLLNGECDDCKHLKAILA